MLEDQRWALPDEMKSGWLPSMPQPCPCPAWAQISENNDIKEKTEAGASELGARRGEGAHGGLGWHAVSKAFGCYVIPELQTSLYMKLSDVLAFEGTNDSTR